MSGNRRKLGNYRRSERRSLPAASQSKSRIGVGEAMQRFEKTGRIDNSRWDGDQLTAASSRPTAVPLFDHRQQRRLHAFRHVESLCEALCNLARVLESFAHEYAPVQREVETALQPRRTGPASR